MGHTDPGRVRTSIVIPTWDRAALLDRCLASVGRHTDRPVEVVVVDNGSRDATSSVIHRHGYDATAVRLPENLGFAKGCNAGARRCTTDYVCFLNNDTEVAPGWLGPLERALDDDEAVAAANPLLLYPDGRIQCAGVATFPERGRPLVARERYHEMPATTPGALVRREMKCLTGACLLVRRADFDAVGGFDELYYNGQEDVDLCFSLVARGRKLVYEPASRVVHLESASGPERWKRRDENRRRLFEKWSGRIEPEFASYAAANA